MKQINIEDKAIFDKYINSTILNSEYQFSTLFAWAERYNFSYEESDNALYIFGTQNNGNLQCYFPLGCSSLEKSINYIKNVFSQNNMPVNLRPLSLEMLNSLLPYLDFPITIGSKPSYSDYICDFIALSKYSGSQYRKKRKASNSFYKKNIFTYRSLNITNVDIAIDGLYNILFNSGNSIDIDEWNAYLRILNNFDKLNLRGGMIFINDVLVGISVAQPYCNDIMILIRRCNKAYDGIYPAMLQLLLNHEFSDQIYRYVNLQDDMGIENIRNTKLSYKPVIVLKKYFIIEERDYHNSHID